MNTCHPYFPRSTSLFKGSNPPAGPIQAPPAPPPSESSIEVTQAKIDAKKQAKARGGYQSTVLAGNTTPAAAGQDQTNPGGKNTVLGGG